MVEEKDMVPIYIAGAARTGLIRLRGEVIAATGNLRVTYTDVINMLITEHEARKKTAIDPGKQYLPDGPVVGGI